MQPGKVRIWHDPQIRANMKKNKRTANYLYNESFEKVYKRIQTALKIFKQPYKSKSEMMAQKVDNFRYRQVCLCMYILVITNFEYRIWILACPS